MSRYYSWSHEETGRLTQRQARGYYNRISEVERMFAGGESENGGTKEQSLDLNEIFAEADDLGIPTPPRK